MAIVPIDTVTPANTHSTGMNHKLDRIVNTRVPIDTSYPAAEPSTLPPPNRGPRRPRSMATAALIRMP